MVCVQHYSPISRTVMHGPKAAKRSKAQTYRVRERVRHGHEDFGLRRDGNDSRDDGPADGGDIARGASRRRRPRPVLALLDILCRLRTRSNEPGAVTTTLAIISLCLSTRTKETAVMMGGRIPACQQERNEGRKRKLHDCELVLERIP